MGSQSTGQRSGDPRDVGQLGHIAERPDAVAKCDDGPSPGRPDAGKTVEFMHSCAVEVDWTRLIRDRSVGTRPTEHESGCPLGERRWAHPGNAVEPVEPSECAMFLAIRDDPLGGCWTDPGDPSQLLGGGPVDVDALIGVQRRGQPLDGVAMGTRVAVVSGVEQDRG